MVVHQGALEAAVAVRTQRLQDEAPQGVVVEAVAEVARGGQGAASVSLMSGSVEVVEANAEYGSPVLSERGGPLVGQGGLAGGVGPIHGDAHGVGGHLAGDQAGKAFDDVSPLRAHG